MAFNPQRTEPVVKRAVSETQKRLWDALHQYCRQLGGAVVSVPHHRTLRIEIPRSENSMLATKLAQAGYMVHHCGVTSRIAGGAFTSVDVLEIDLPKC